MIEVMDPVIDNEWLGCKNDPIDDPPTLGNIARSWQWRERGVNAPNSPSNKTVLENAAEDVLVQKPLKIRCCDLPGYPRSTFLMVFSPDGTKVASTHGNHNVYVSELASGKHVRILKGHPRTPWCIAFHPSHPQLIGSGCLAGQVRVWDISSGGSEVWNVRNETVIASIAFHPRVQLLVIATYNELYFWDWSQPAPMTKVCTNNINEKVRYVAFDSLGYKLITGISLSSMLGGVDAAVLQRGPTNPGQNSNGRRLHSDDNDGSDRPDTAGATQDVIVNSYQYLVQRYDSLVRNYQRLFMVRNRLAVTPPPNTTDRGTDPMETDPAPEANSYTRVARSYTATTQLDDENQNSNTSNNREEEEGSSGLLNLDALSFDRATPGERNMSRLELAIFGARPSAFQPLSTRFNNENPGRSFRTVDQNERASRLLPNPFSTTNGTPRPNRVSFASSPLTQQSNHENATNASRTSIFTAYRLNSPSVLDLSSPRRWGGNRGMFVSRPNDSPPSNSTSPTRSRQEQPPNTNSNTTNTNTATNTSSSSNLNSVPNVSLSNNSSSNGNTPTNTNPSSNNATRRTSSPPQGSPVDAQTINESLDLIRDILRDSGTRLLNLITNMSASSLPHVDPEIPNRRMGARAHSDDSGESERPRGARPRVRLFSSNLQSEILSSSSESDSDQSSEVNILRTPNTTFREEDSREETSRTTEMPGPSNRSAPPSDRVDSEIDNNSPSSSRDPEGGNASASSSRSRPRTQNNDAGEGPSTASHAPDEPENLTRNSSNYFDPDRPSTSGNNIWSNGNTVPPEEAFRKVRGGVSALQKHTTQLTNMWVRGNRTTMRELRTMWENLRRRIIMLHRETGRQDLPNYYTRSLLERCMMLTEMAGEAGRSAARNNRSQSNMSSYEPRPSTSRSVPDDNRPSLSGRSPSKRPQPPERRYLSSLLSKRLQAAYYRWRPEYRRRNPISSRMSQRYLDNPRREYTRLIEISATRHEIRMRAMQVLSVMFNMMMLCIEERGLSSLIINMLRTLKKALALTCLMIMTNRYNPRSNNNESPQRVDSMNVIRLQNVDHTGPVNVDGPDESPRHSISSEPEEDRQNNPNKRLKRDRSSSTTQSVATENPATDDTTPPTVPTSQEPAQRWSNRLAVQIAAANRNTSMTARTRRDLYVESKKQKALHRTNPLAHPLIKKKVLPPVSTYRIPSLRLTPRRLGVRNNAARVNPANGEPIAGPSGILSGTATVRGGPSRLPPDISNEFEHRINLIRMAHMQAVRLRNAARSRFRRLQTIRLYTPSSVREMFTLQPEGDSSHESRPLQNNSEPSNRRSFTSYDYRPHILTRERIFSRGAANRPSEDSGQFHAVISNTGVPLMQVSDLSISNQDGQGNQNQRLPRIHEYLQPIILAQNAMVVDEEGGEGGGPGGGGGGGGGGGLGAARRMGGMAGLLDAGIISETLPFTSSHRVQAWDFTTGDAPDISNTTKNVVVQRCRIHNDASIDISKDGRLLVALLPVPRLRNANHWLGVYSLEWSRLGQCLHTAVLEQNAVSVALSPTARHLAVGLGSRRFTSAAHSRNNVFALLYRLDPMESSSRTGLSPIKELEQTWEHGFTSLNCLRWAPQAGQGLVYANNTGQLIIMS